VDRGFWRDEVRLGGKENGCGCYSICPGGTDKKTETKSTVHQGAIANTLGKVRLRFHYKANEDIRIIPPQ
jgi:hypothetical protein